MFNIIIIIVIITMHLLLFLFFYFFYYYYYYYYCHYYYYMRYIVILLLLFIVLFSLLDKTEADSDRERALIDQWVSLTEERNAVMVPAAGSGIPGAPADG